MSEHQYYEFQTVDNLLTGREQAALETLLNIEINKEEYGGWAGWLSRLLLLREELMLGDRLS